MNAAHYLRTAFAANVRMHAARLGIPLNHLADLSGVSRSHLYVVLATDSSPTLDVVARVAMALGVPAHVLISTGSTPARPTASRGRGSHPDAWEG